MNYNPVEVLLIKSNNSYTSALNDYHAELYDRAISSLYYSAFQSLSALMVDRGLFSKKHTHTRSYLNKDLVNTGQMSVELGGIYNTLMDARDEADYSPIIMFTREDVEHYLTGVKQFNTVVRDLIKK